MISVNIKGEWVSDLPKTLDIIPMKFEFFAAFVVRTFLKVKLILRYLTVIYCSNLPYFDYLTQLDPFWLLIKSSGHQIYLLMPIFFVPQLSWNFIVWLMLLSFQGKIRRHRYRTLHSSSLLWGCESVRMRQCPRLSLRSLAPNPRPHPLDSTPPYLLVTCRPHLPSSDRHRSYWQAQLH